MAKQEATPTINDDTLLVLIASIQSLTLTLQTNLQAGSAQPALATPPPTAPSASTSTNSATGSSAAPAPTAPTTVPATAPEVLPIISPGIPPAPPGPIPPPATFGELAEVYLTPLARSSRGVHPTVLQALPDIVSAAETGPWFVVTVGRYTGVYQEWHEVSPMVTGWSAACYRRHSTKSSALAAYDNAWIRGNVHGGVHPNHQL